MGGGSLAVRYQLLAITRFRGPIANPKHKSRFNRWEVGL